MPIIEDLSPSERWAAGIALCFANSVLSSLGFTLQRKAHLLAERHGEESEGCDGPATKVPVRYTMLMYLGVTMYAVSCIPDMFAYMLIPQILCSTVACLRLVMVTVMAHFVLAEACGLREIAGMSLCTIGAGCCLAYGPTVYEETFAESPEMALNFRVSFYLAGGTCLLVTLIILDRAGLFELGSNMYVLLPATAALADCLEKVLLTEVGFVKAPRYLLDEPGWWVLMVLIVWLAATVFYCNFRGAQAMPVTVYVPCNFAMCTALQFVQAYLILREFDGLASNYAIISLCGASVALCGAICIRPPNLKVLTNMSRTKTKGVGEMLKPLVGDGLPA